MLLSSTALSTVRQAPPPDNAATVTSALQQPRQQLGPGEEEVEGDYSGYSPLQEYLLGLDKGPEVDFEALRESGALGNLPVVDSPEPQLPTTVFQSRTVPIGVSTDALGTVFVNYLDVLSGSLVEGFDPGTAASIAGPWIMDGSLSAVPGTLHTLNSGANLPGAVQGGDLVTLQPDGTIKAVRPTTGQVITLVDVASLSIDLTNVYDVKQQDFFDFTGIIDTSNASYGDISVFETQSFTDIYVSGNHTAVMPARFGFVARLRYVSGALDSAQVILVSSDPVANARGVAVNQYGLGLTTLPSGFGYDSPIIFTVGFPENPDDVIVANALQLTAEGIAADAGGNFWIANTVEGVNNGADSGVYYFPGNLSTLPVGVFAASGLVYEHDVALSPDARAIYLTIAAPAPLTPTDEIWRLDNPFIPTLTSLSDSPDPVMPGRTSLRLTPGGVCFPNPARDYEEVDFFRESNGTPGLQLDPMTGDTFVGYDGIAVDGFGINVDTTFLTAGAKTYYAVAFDGQYMSDIVSTTNTIQSLPDLLPYTPAGWSAPLVLSNVTGGNVDTPLTEGDTFYLDAALANVGPATAAASTMKIYLDGTLVFTVNNPSLNASTYASVEDAIPTGLQSVTAGVHQLELRVDPDNLITEDKTDNAYFKFFSVQPAPPPPAGQWVPQGGGPILEGGTLISTQDNPVIGAIQTIAPHPTDPDILYIGPVNGGIWKTTNATAALPDWTPLTDDQASLTIGALEFDPTDATHQTLVAGFGQQSSFAVIRGSLPGLLRSTDGGATWTPLGATDLADQNITSVAARGNLLLAASDNTWPGSFDPLIKDDGLFRSTDGGASFQLISGAGGTGLPAGRVSDLVGDPSSVNRFYAAVLPTINTTTGAITTSGGLFRSDDDGATWSDVTGSTGALINDDPLNFGSSQNPHFVGTNRIELAVHYNSVGGTNAVYAGVVFTDQLAGVFRSANQGATWTAMDVPDVHQSPSPQGSLDLGIVADPTNANIVYLSGDTIPLSPYTGLVFRGDASLASGSQFTPIVYDFADADGSAGLPGTVPHADSRDMAFAADGTLLEADDGGIFRRTSPTSSTGVWKSVIGNLHVTEFHNVAYDANANIIFGGAQDNGINMQMVAGSTVYRNIHGGDGGDVGVDTITLAAQQQSLRYFSSQNLGGFIRATFDADNVELSEDVLDTSVVTDPQFVTPFELNAIDPQRMIIGGSQSVYESLNQGDTITRIAMGVGVNGTLLQAGSPIAYGGRSGGVDNPDVLYVGFNNQVYVRTAAAETLNLSGAAFPGGDIRDIVLDPNDWMTAFVIDDSHVYRTANAGQSWTDVTGNLASTSVLRSLAYISKGAVSALVVGTNLGVYASTAATIGAWSKLGSALPNAPVTDMAYDAGDDVLVAGTMGRGAWKLPDASTAIGAAPAATTSIGLDGSNNLLIEDTGGADTNDTLTISINGGNVRVFDPANALQAGTGASQVNANTIEVPLTTITGGSITINSLGGDDALTIDFSGGDFVAPITSIDFQGGTQNTAPNGDSLSLQGGGTFADAIFSFSNASDGSIDITGNATITYTGLEPITSSITATNVTLNYSTAAETIAVTDAGAGQTIVTSTAGESTTFANPTGLLAINAGDTNGDVVTLTSLATAFPGDVTVDGQGGSDAIQVDGAVSLAAGKHLSLAAEMIGLNGPIAVAGSGSVSITAGTSITMAPGSSITTEDGGVALTANAAGTATGDFVGITLDNASITTTGDGGIAITGTGGNTANNHGVVLQNGSLVMSTKAAAGAGTIHITGTGQGGTGTDGVRIVDVGTTVASQVGAIQIMGTSTDDDGVVIANDAVVESQGTGTIAATITIDGTSGPLADSNGVAIGNAAAITSIDGDIAITGDGANGLRGVFIFTGVTLMSTGTTGDAATITIDGTSGVNDAVHVYDSQISSAAGDVAITGDATNGAAGVNLYITANVQVASGLLQVTGTGGSGPGVKLSDVSTGSLLSLGSGAIQVTSLAGGISAGGDSVIGGPGDTGDITLTTDALTLTDTGGAGQIRSTGALTIKPNTASESIGLGSGAGTLNIDSAELSYLADGFSSITIGDAAGGTGDADILSAAFTDPVTIVGGAINVTGLDAGANDVNLVARTGNITDGTLSPDISGANTTLDGNVTPGQSPGLLIVNGNLGLFDNLIFTVEIGGTTPGTGNTDHDQAIAAGAVTIGSNVTLSTLSYNGFVPSAGQSFTIIDSTGGVTGTFVGLAEGGVISNFLGSGLDATITYQGGVDGQDVVLQVQGATAVEVSVAVAPAAVNEDDTTNLVYTFTRTGDTSAALSVAFDVSGTAAFIGDYAASGADTFAASAGAVTIAAGSATATVTIDPNVDPDIEPDETVVLTVTTGAGYVVGAPAAATGTITNDDNPQGPRQIVSGAQATVSAAPGQPLAATVQYNTSDDNALLSGLGLRMHFDSSFVSFDSLTGLLADGFIIEQVQADAADHDNDPSTDMVVVVAWAKVDGDWPNQPLPIDLFTANFTVNAGQPVGATSQINFTASSAAAGYAFQGDPIQLLVAPPINLDVDNNGDTDALTDGMLIMRYLFEFTDQALVNGVLGPGAQRTDPQDIADYLASATDTMLDVDDNGNADALSDGLIILRYMYQFAGAALVNGALPPNAQRTDPNQIIAFLDGYNPNLPQPADPATPPAAPAPLRVSSPSGAMLGAYLDRQQVNNPLATTFTLPNPLDDSTHYSWLDA